MVQEKLSRQRIALLIPECSGSWIGGVNYYYNLIAQCNKFVPNSIVFTVITCPDCTNKIAEMLPEGTDIITSRLVSKYSLIWFVRNVTFALLGKDLLMQRFLSSHQIDILTHSKNRNYGKEIKVIGWIPDCQHKHLPGFFSSRELKKRDDAFQQILDKSDKVIVSSRTAYVDVHDFFRVNKDHVEVLRFYKQSTSAQVQQVRQDLANKYQLPQVFFYLPNQFWKHKNHRVVIHALKILKSEKQNIVVVCTGNTQDYRAPKYFNDLLEEVKTAGLDNYFRVLGMVPLDDVNALIKYSIALINPSLFEGWSTSVEEARANGKRIILSDIPVHREQSPPGALFFNSESALELSLKIKQVITEFNQVNEEARELQALKDAIYHSKAFALEYEKMCCLVANNENRS